MQDKLAEGTKLNIVSMKGQLKRLNNVKTREEDLYTKHVIA